MSKESKKPIEKDDSFSLEVNMEQQQSRGALTAKQQVESYLERKAAVTQADHEAFQDYLNQKAQAKAQTAAATTDEAEPIEAAKPPSKFNRRNLLKVVAGTAIGAEAIAIGYRVTAGSVSEQGAKHAGDRYTEAQRHNIERQLVDPRADMGGRGLGRWVALLPTKMGGGAYAIDLNTGRVLALALGRRERGGKGRHSHVTSLPRREVFELRGDICGVETSESRYTDVWLSRAIGEMTRGACRPLGLDAIDRYHPSRRDGRIIRGRGTDRQHAEREISRHPKFPSAHERPSSSSCPHTA